MYITDIHYDAIKMKSEMIARAGPRRNTERLNNEFPINPNTDQKITSNRMTRVLGENSNVHANIGLRDFKQGKRAFDYSR